MKNLTLIFVALALTACATAHQEERINAVKDFIEVNDLSTTESMRTFEKIEQDVLNDEYVILTVGDEIHLIEYSYRCTEDPLTQRPKADVRRNARRIYADSDTWRGCQIKSIYPISEEQAEELREIGEAPGED